MKKFAYLFLAVVAVTATSCSKNMNSASPSSMTVEQQKSILIFSPWEVTKYRQKGKNHTTDFSGYTFQFNTDGTLMVSGNGLMTTGTWTLNKETSNKHDDFLPHDSGADDNQMTLIVTGNAQMDEISEDWTIVRLSDTEMWLNDGNVFSGKEIRFSR
jgi:hypothetical protein